ncbi:MAG TPA: metallophosphoesterase [Methylomirabilota bacterium]|nr:metallophosphoesterase [Methylomirabilota bacterium]
MKLRCTLWLLIALSQTVSAQPLLLVKMISPVHGTTLHSNLFPLVAEVSDQDGFAVEVKFYVNDVYFGSAFQPPFELPVLLGNGRYRVRALATNSLGFVAWSARSSFQVGGEYPVNVVRGPYLQSMSSTSVVIRWRTDWPTNSVVCCNSNTICATNHVRTNEHEVLLSGLDPDTRYSYAFGSDTETFAAVTTNLAFRTAPTNTRPVTIWVIGDSGKANMNAAAVRDGYLDSTGPANTDLWLMLGDNAYESGTDDEYQAAVFDLYREILETVPVWPTLGNHDADSVGSPGQFPYFDIFTFPKNGEAGGVPSGTEKYYSFDYANIHFICLDSHSSSRAGDGPMLNWLREDLAATDKDWIIAFWHHPPYSKGTHDSDTEIQLVEMRQQAVPILESHGVDLVLCGHSHVYERSYLLNGHYGTTNTLTPSMILDSTFGDTPPYRKPAGGLGADGGTVYAVCGCSGEGGLWHYPWGMHPAMARSLTGFGSMILRVDGLSLEARFLRPNGDVDDYFIIDKSQPTSVRPGLELARTLNGAELSWPTSLPIYALESAEGVGTNGAWQSVSNPVKRAGRRNVVNVTFESTNQFFRLQAR